MTVAGGRAADAGPYFARASIQRGALRRARSRHAPPAGRRAGAGRGRALRRRRRAASRSRAPVHAPRGATCPTATTMRELAVVPALAVTVTPRAGDRAAGQAAGKRSALQVELLNNARGEVDGAADAASCRRDGRSEPAAHAVHSSRAPGEQSRHPFTVARPGDREPRVYAIEAVATAGGREYHAKATTSSSTAISRRATSIATATSRVRGVDVKIAPRA